MATLLVFKENCSKLKEIYIWNKLIIWKVQKENNI